MVYVQSSKKILSRDMPRSVTLIEDNGGLDGALVLHRLETLGPLLQLERLVDDSCDLDLALVCSDALLAG